MPGVVMSLFLSLMVAGVVWLFIGSRIEVSRDAEQNHLLNFFVYLLIALPFSVVLVFYALQ